MTMTEPTRRAGKPLLKQTEIEEVEADDIPTEENGSPNSDISDATITPATCTIPVCIQSASDSPENGSPEETVPVPPVVTVNYPEYRREGFKRSSNSLKLTRGEALCDDASPPPLDLADAESPAYDPPTGYDTLVLPNNKLEKQGSQGSDTSASPCLSRDSSLDSNYKDTTGVDLVEFIRKTVNKSIKDKKMLLQLERDFKKFIKEPKHQYLQLPEMSSYDRMVVHRIAAFFGLDHNVDQRGKSVIVSKTKKTRVPDLVFEDFVLKGGESQPKRQILPRIKAPSMDEKESKGLQKPHLGNMRAKSLEERQKSYDEHRGRIFNGEDEQQPQSIALRSSKGSLLSSKEDMSNLPWSSTDSSGYGTDNSGGISRRLPPKAHSYCGPATRTESFGSCQGSSFDSGLVRPPNAIATPPIFYHSDASRSSSAGPMQSPVVPGQSQPLPLIIAPPDIRSIPPGSLMIDPQTMLPYRNSDGSYYQYDPKQPPPPWLSGATNQQQHHQQMSTNIPPYSPMVRQTSVDSVGDMCQKLHTVTFTPHIQHGDSMEMAPQSSHPPTIIMGSPQTYPLPPQQQPIHTVPQQPSNPPYVPTPYYQSPGVTGQPLRYVYPMTTYGPHQGSECHNHPNNTNPLVGQYSQQFIPGYPGYQNIVHQGTPQTQDIPPGSYQTTPVYPGASHPADNMTSYSLQYPTQSQQSFGHQSHSPVYYSVPQTASPQMAFTFTGQNSLRAATPPSQPSANIPNPNLAINLAQSFPYTQPGGASVVPSSNPGNSFTSYQPYPPHQFTTHQPRPVNQVLQFSGLQSHSQPQGISVLRPGIPINMQPSGMTANNIGQTMAPKGYQVTGCVHKTPTGLMGDVNKDGSVTLISGGGAGVAATSPLTPQVLQHIQCPPGAGDYRMVSPAPVHTQLQSLQFSTTANKPHPTHSQVPKTRPVVPSVVSVRNTRQKKVTASASKDLMASSSNGSSSSDSASNQNACKIKTPYCDWSDLMSAINQRQSPWCLALLEVL